VVIRLVADADTIVTGQHHDAAWFGCLLPNNAELFGEIPAGQLHVARDTEVVRDLHFTFEKSRESAAFAMHADAGLAYAEDAIPRPTFAGNT